MNGSAYHAGVASSRHDGEVQIDIKSAGATPMAPATLGERIELLDGETRSCWKRFDVLEDEEISLNDQLARLEKIRRGERMQILRLEQACKATEVITLKAQEETADHDAESQALEGLALDALEEAGAATAAAAATVSGVQQGSSSDGNNDDDAASSRPIKGSAALVAALSKVPPHEEKRRQLTSLLHDIENQTRSDIAEAARSAAELRLSAKKRDSKSMPLERETAALRNKLADMAGGDEIQARMARARQAGEGVHRRLQHANNKLDSVRGALAQGSARHLEEAEQQSLALMQSIAEVKARIRTREGLHDDGPRTPRFPAREGRPSTSAPRLQMQSTSNDGRNGTRYKDPGHSPRGKKREWA